MLSIKFLVIVEEPKKSKKVGMAFLYDQSNALKMQMSTLDHESRQK